MAAIYNKLIRDKIPEIIEQAGKTCTVEILGEEEYLLKLDEKLNEECAEYQKDKNVEELADILEVVYAIAKAKGVSEKELNSLRTDKAERRGAFEKKLLLKYVEE